MSTVTIQILELFLVITAGFVCRKLKILTEEGTGTLSGIVVKIILPAYLFNAIATSEAGVDKKGVLIALGVSVLMYAVSILIALIVVPALRPDNDDRGVYLFETMCGNVTYIGIPVCVAVFGQQAAFYASILNIPYNLLCFSLGVFLLSGKKDLKKIFNPVFVAGVIAVIFYSFGIKLPVIITDACRLAGQATTPCALLVVGSVLAGIPLNKLFSEWRIIPYTLLRLFGIAAIMLLILLKMNIDPVLKGVVVLMAAMPAATNSTMLCTIYGGNRELSAKLIFVTTALSLATIPLWSSFLAGVLN